MLNTTTQFLTLTTSATVVSTGNPNRVAVHIQNLSCGQIYLRFGDAPSVVNGTIIGITIPANGDYIRDQQCPTGQIFLLGSDPLNGNNIVIEETQ